MKTNTINNKAIGGVLALALMASAVPYHKVEAATIAELQAQIQVLLAQLQAQASGNNNSGTCLSFNSNLTIGSSGAEVKSLQEFLMKNGHVIPAGATSYFGGQTQAALVQFQLKQNIQPAVGYFGPLTRAKVNSLCNDVVTTPGNGNTTNPKPTNPGNTLEGEASFERFDVKNGDDTDLEEAQKLAPVMEVSFRVEDGDAQINRMDLAFTPDSGNQEKKPWKVYKEVSIYQGSERIAKIDVSSKAVWKENNPTSGSYMLRMPGLNKTVKKGDEVELVVKVTTANAIDGTNDGELWNIFVPNDGIRAFDADKVAIYAGDNADYVTVNIEKSGSSDKLVVKRSDSDPDSTTLQLKDNGRSGFMTVFAFDLDSSKSVNDIEVRKLPIAMTVSSGTVDTFARDVRIKVNGKTYTKKTIVDGATNSMVFEFSSGDFIIKKGERVTVEVEVDFKALALGNEGVEITGSMNASSITAEGARDLSGSQLSGVATGETHVLRTKGIIGEPVATASAITTANGPTNDYATYTIQAKITAFGQDVYIPTDVATAVAYQLENASGAAVVDTGVPIITSNAKEVVGYFKISEGETKTVTLEVTYMPGVALTTARLQLLNIQYSDSASAPTQTWNAVPSSKYETTTKTIID